MLKKILMVDDEEPVRALVVATIKYDGRYIILEAKDGLEALEVARREKPDVILLDIFMPGLDGFEVCRQLKADPETRGITVIMLTALAQDSDKEKAQQVGASGYFTKPFSPKALVRKLEEVLGS